jgi:hypothetical protein
MALSPFIPIGLLTDLSHVLSIPGVEVECKTMNEKWCLDKPLSFTGVMCGPRPVRQPLDPAWAEDLPLLKPAPSV